LSGQSEGGMFAEERKRQIVAYVNRNMRVTVGELCTEFSVSPATIRNDLNELHEKGLLKRTHGGCMANIQTNFEPITNEKHDKFLKEKQSMAREALKYINEGDCIALDAGTTTYELAKLLGEFKKLMVVTFDLNIASYLDTNTEVSLFVAGGEVRKGHHYMIGNTSIDTISKLNVDTFFLAANGISIKKGVTTPQLDTAIMKECIIGNSRQCILLADSSKIDNISFAKFAEISDLDVFITDEYADIEILERLRSEGIRIDVAKIEK
jgi:DeoR family fructose operon transcriptional repressor